MIELSLFRNIQVGQKSAISLRPEGLQRWLDNGDG